MDNVVRMGVTALFICSLNNTYILICPYRWIVW